MLKGWRWVGEVGKVEKIDKVEVLSLSPYLSSLLTRDMNQAYVMLRQ
jgi:hypothetical protein